MPPPDSSQPRRVDVEHVANALERAYEDPPHRGRAIFLIGAGCSVSAGIPAAAGTAQRAATHLAELYSRRLGGNRFQPGPPDAAGAVDVNACSDAALEWLVERNRVRREDVPLTKAGLTDWGGLYRFFFENHIVSPNEQREFFTRLVQSAQGGRDQVRVNWAHACLGELVARGFVHTVLTTNFDQLALSAIIRAGGLPVVADGLSAFNRIVARPPIPQLVHLHGSMHTYELRNTKRAILQTSEERPAYGMIHQMLQQCQVLVVVGYAGAEEGVMRMLLEEAQSMDGLVVYWVVHSDDADLSPDARSLLELENKFLVVGGEADKFFGDIMQRLDLGQPRWVGDPIAELESQRDLLVAPVAGPDGKEVAILIASYVSAIDYAVAHGRDTAPGDPLVRAIELRVQGKFKEARDALREIPRPWPAVVSRQDALNARDLFQWDRTGSRALLDEAITGFRTLAAQVGGPQRIEDLNELLSALSDLNDLRNEGADRLVDVGALEEIITIVDACIDDFEADGGSRATLLYARAAARQQIADHAEDVAGLADAAEDYREALLLLEGVGDTSDLASEVRDGLAGALQVLGSKSEPPDVGRLQEAVDLFAISAVRPLLNDSAVARGAVAFNLANAWTAYWLAARAPGADTTSFKQAVIWTGRAEKLFMQANQPSRIAEARSLVAQLAANEPF